MTTAPMGRSTDVERWIASFGLDAHLIPDMPIDQIDIEASLANQARRDPRDADTVTVYQQAMAAGAVFPPLVAFKKGSKYVLMDGNHRCGGAIGAGFDAVAVYEVQVSSDDPRVLDMVASANAALNGKSAADDDKLRHGIRMIDAGSSIKEAARLCGVSATNLGQTHKAEIAARKFDRIGLGRKARSLSKQNLGALLPIADKGDRTLAEGVLDAVPVAKNSTDLRTLVSTVVASPGDAEALIEAFIHERTAINNTKASRQGREQAEWQAFKMHAAAIAKLTPEVVAASCPPDQRQAIERLAEEVRFVSSRLVA